MDEAKPAARLPTVEHREPYESRGSRTVLGAPGGEIPPGDSFGCDAHDGSRSTAMLLLGESHAAGTASLSRAGSLGAVQSARDGIAVCRAHGNIARRQSRRRDDASGEKLDCAVRLDFSIHRVPTRLTLLRLSCR